jgi:hypothetical protein
MTKTKTQKTQTCMTLLLLWIITALSVVCFVAGFNIAVDPFGYFGRNSLGFYFSSERQFKFSLVQSYDYNAIALGDSRIAYTDTSQINYPGYRFVNGGIGGASVAELVALLSASRLDRLKLVVFGLQYGDLAHCSGDQAPAEALAPTEYGPWEPLRFAASWTQLVYAIEALIAHAQGLSPNYQEDGSRSTVSKHFEEAALDRKTARYWEKIERDIPQEPRDLPNYDFGPKCQELLSQARELSARHSFALMVVFLPRNGDLLKHLRWDTPEARAQVQAFTAKVGKIVPHVVDLSTGAFSDSRNFWLDDSMHFKPAVGALLLKEAISRSGGAQASK